MKLPFIQHIGTGVHFTKQSIRWVELSRIRHRLFIRQSAVETIEHGDDKTALCKLVNQIRPSSSYVTTNLDPGDVHQMVLEVPFHDDEDGLSGWITDAKKKLLPEEASLEDFAVSHYLYGDTEETQNCLFVMARKEAVKARIELLHSAGLQPVTLTPGDLETGYGLMFDRNFIAVDALLIKSFENYGCLLEYQHGLLAGVQIFNETEDANELIEEAKSMLAGRSGYRDGESGMQLYLASGQVLNHSGNHGIPGIKIREVNPLSHLTFNKETLPTGQAIACGMAVKQLYPGLDTINFLDSSTIDSARETIEKKDALITAASVSGVLLLIFLILAMAGWIIENKKQQLDEQADVMEDKIIAVENARQQVHGLRSSILQVRSLVDKRNPTVRLLETVGRELPEGVWLDEIKLSVDSDSGNPIRISIQGYALRDHYISVLLEKLEQQKEIRDIRLIYSEQVETSDIYEDRSYREKSLIYYEIQMQAND